MSGGGGFAFARSLAERLGGSSFGRKKASWASLVRYFSACVFVVGLGLGVGAGTVVVVVSGRVGALSSEGALANEILTLGPRMEFTRERHESRFCASMTSSPQE